jgi:hypothetical protein
LREFLRASEGVGPYVSLTLLRLDEWTASPEAGTEAGAGRSPASDVVENIAESLIEGAVGLERKLLSKSLQEALYYSVDFDPNITATRFKTLFVKYLSRCGAPSFIKRFLSLFFFNFVWHETSESFRALARTSDAFEEDMECIDETCQRIVSATWKTFQSRQCHLDLSAAEELVRTIERRLRGV